MPAPAEQPDRPVPGREALLKTSWLLWLGETPVRWEQLPKPPVKSVTTMVSRLGYHVSGAGALWTFNFDTRAWTRLTRDQPSVSQPHPATMFRLDVPRRLAMVVGARCGYVGSAAVRPYLGKPCTWIHVFDLGNLGAGAVRWDLTGDLDFLQLHGPGLAKHPTNGLWYGWQGQREVWTFNPDTRVVTKLPTLPGTIPAGNQVDRGMYGRWAWSAPPQRLRGRAPCRLSRGALSPGVGPLAGQHLTRRGTDEVARC